MQPAGHRLLTPDVDNNIFQINILKMAMLPTQYMKRFFGDYWGTAFRLCENTALVAAFPSWSVAAIMILQQHKSEIYLRMLHEMLKMLSNYLETFPTPSKQILAHML
jgi:hypothetical protein